MMLRVVFAAQEGGGEGAVEGVADSAELFEEDLDAYDSVRFDDAFLFLFAVQRLDLRRSAAPQVYQYQNAMN